MVGSGARSRAVGGSLMFAFLFVLAFATPAQGALCDLLRTCKPPPPPQCSDGYDNDRDAVGDLRDPGCASPEDRWESDDDAPDLGEAVMGPIPTGKTLGFNTSLGMWDSGVTPPQEAALIGRAGGSAQRMFVRWRSIQPDGPGQFENAERVDALYENMQAAGIRPVIGIIAAPAWAACSMLDLRCRRRVVEDRNVPPRWDRIPEYGSFAARLAQRYPAATIEAWNEPNHASFWVDGGFPDSARMARMQCTAYDAVKQQRPTQLVSSPGIVWGEPYMTSDGRTAGLLEYLRGMYAHMGRVCWDQLSVHLYPGSDIDGPDSAPARLLRVLRNLRPRYGDASQIRIGKPGVTTTGDGGEYDDFTDAEQAAFVNGAIGELLAAPEVQAVFVHTLRERSHEHLTWSSPHYGFGLLRETAGPEPPPKPAYCALVARAGNTYAGC